MEKEENWLTKISMIMEYIHTNLNVGESIYTRLMDCKRQIEVYKRFAFKKEQNDNARAGKM